MNLLTFFSYCVYKNLSRFITNNADLDIQNWLDEYLNNQDLYETHRIQSGIPDYVKDIGEHYNPLEANLHSHFGKNYEYSKRRRGEIRS